MIGGILIFEMRGAEAHIENVNYTLTDLDEGKWPLLMKQAGLKIEREELVERMGICFFSEEDRLSSSTLTRIISRCLVP